MSYRFDEFLSALKEVQRVMCEVEAWNDNDGSSSLNEFAFSEVGGDRSRLLQQPIRSAQYLASTVLQFNRDGALSRRDMNSIRDAGFEISSGCHEHFVDLDVPPTQRVLDEWENEDQDEASSDGRYEPTAMSLTLISTGSESDYEDD